MQKISDNNDNYSNEYRARFSQALMNSSTLGFTRDLLISEKNTIADDVLRKVSGLLGQFSAHLSVICPGYWGNSCQTLSTNIFAYLNAQGIPADIVIGNVIINGTDEFDTTLELIRDEVLGSKPLDGPQSVHAWISLGDDTIVDAALPPRLVKYYGAPAHFDDMIFIGRASEFSVKYRLHYQPVVVGTEFFAKTNPPDPMELLNDWRRQKENF
ncbi:MAG: hypothetical protein WA191_19845 [Telluria sp.]